MPGLYQRCGRKKKDARCNICYGLYQACDFSSNPIVNHLITHHPDDCFKCYTCDGLFITKREACHKTHQNYSPVKKKQCEKCRVFETPENQVTSKHGAGDEFKYLCYGCSIDEINKCHSSCGDCGVCGRSDALETPDIMIMSKYNHVEKFKYLCGDCCVREIMGSF